MVQGRLFHRGQGLVEYALILVLVAIVVIAILALLGPEVGQVFSEIIDALGNRTAMGGSGGGPPAGGNNPPVADAGGPYTLGPSSSPRPCLSQWLDASGSYDPDTGDTIILYEWDWNNDSIFEFGPTVPSGYTYDRTTIVPWGGPMYPGDTRTIVLRVTDNNGAQSTDVTTVTLHASCPPIT